MFETHFGLTGRPFRLTPDPDFWFESAAHRTAMTHVGYGLARGEGLIVVTGDAGAGKTMLAAHLLGRIDPERTTVGQLPAIGLGRGDLLPLVAGAFGIDCMGIAGAALLGRFEYFLTAQAAEGRRTLLIVDEAQNIAPAMLDEIRMLADLRSGGEPLFQVVLFGTSAFRDKLAGAEQLEQFRGRIVATCHIDPVTKEEVGPLITHRLARAGWTGTPEFAPDAWTALHRWSNGNPGRLNHIAGQVMLAAAVEDRCVVDGALVEAAVRDGEDVTPSVAPRPPIGSRPLNVSVTPIRAEPVGPVEQRLAALEVRCEEQEAALRRVLALMIDLVEADAAPRAGQSYASAA